MQGACRHCQRVREDGFTGDDDGQLQRGYLAPGERGGPQRPGPARGGAGARRGADRLPGHPPGPGGVRRLRQHAGPERRPAHPRRRPRGLPGRGGVPGAALRPQTPQRQRAHGGGRRPGGVYARRGGTAGEAAGLVCVSGSLGTNTFISGFGNRFSLRPEQDISHTHPLAHLNPAHIPCPLNPGDLNLVL